MIIYAIFREPPTNHPPPTNHHQHGLMTCPSSLCLVQRPLSVTPGRCFLGVPSSELSSDEEKSSWIHLWTQHDMSSPENILCKMLGILGDLLWKMKVWKGTPIFLAKSAQWNPDVNQFLRQKIVSLCFFQESDNLNINENGFVSFQPPHTFRRRTRCSKFPFLRTFFVTDSNLQQQSRSHRNLHNCCRIIDVCQFTRIFMLKSICLILFVMFGRKNTSLDASPLGGGHNSRFNTSCGHSEQQTKP